MSFNKKLKKGENVKIVSVVICRIFFKSEFLGKSWGDCVNEERKLSVYDGILKNATAGLGFGPLLFKRE